MIRVRFNTGLVVRYDSLNWAKHYEGRMLLYENDKSIGWSASVPLEGCLIEITTPSQAYREPDAALVANLSTSCARLARQLRSARAANAKLRAKKGGVS